MASKFLVRTAVLAATLLTAAACIYPYEVDITRQGEYPLVVEGDLHLGGMTTLTLTHVRPFDTEGYEFPTVHATAYYEGEDGTRIQGVPTSGPSYSSFLPANAVLQFDFNTVDIPVQRYRLHFETLSRDGTVTNVFDSSWMEPTPAPTIERLSYSRNEQFRELWIGLTMHCHGAHHFRWTFSETWEYHSDVYSPLKYDPVTRSISEYEGPTLYYCWNKASSTKINIFSTTNQTEDRFEDLSFHTIPLSDKRLQILYRIDVRLEAISEDAYDYWYNIQQNTNGQGSIFAPTPSEMAGNIHCLTDPDLQVLGFLNAGIQTEAVLFYDNNQNSFYEPGPRFARNDTTIRNHPDSMAEIYSANFLPFQEVYDEVMVSDTPSYYIWTPSICIDCRMQGGTKTKPEGWPNNHE